MSKKDKDHMVWMDMEMTGLDVKNERIIEIATVITNSDLEIVAEGPHLVIHQGARILGRMDEWNKKHHKKSGLIEAVLKSKTSVKKAEQKTLTFLKKYCVEGQAVLCGNSVHHDRRFLIEYMPRIHDYLHYRIVDVSSLKDLIRRWYDKKVKAPAKKTKHRALDDILESIEELRFYRKTYFKRAARRPVGTR